MTVRHIGTRLVVLLALSVVFSLTAIPAATASCAEPVSVEEAIEQAEVVFVGRVVSLDFEDRIAGFEVEDVWRGDVESRVLVSGGPRLSELEELRSRGQSMGTSVDRVYIEGETYLVVPFGIEEGVYMDNNCSVTQPYDDSLIDFRPDSAHPPTPDTAGMSNEVLVARVTLGAFAFIVLGAGVLSLVRRRSIPASID